MPWFEVTVVASAAVVVEANDEDEATSLAFDEAFEGYEVKETTKTVALENSEEIERSRRHADIVLEV